VLPPVAYSSLPRSREQFKMHNSEFTIKKQFVILRSIATKNLYKSIRRQILDCTAFVVHFFAKSRCNRHVERSGSTNAASAEAACGLCRARRRKTNEVQSNICNLAQNRFFANAQNDNYGKHVPQALSLSDTEDLAPGAGSRPQARPPQPARASIRRMNTAD